MSEMAKQRRCRLSPVGNRLYLFVGAGSDIHRICPEHILYCMYFVVSNEYDTFRSQSKETQQELVRVASGNIDPADLEKAADSSFFNSKNYRRITNTIIRDFHMYQVSSDTAAVVMVPDKNNDKSYYIASNRGFGELLGSNSTFDDLTGEITYKNRYVTKESDNKIISCAGIFDSSGKTAGYLCVFIQSKNVNDSFFNMWSVPMMLGWLMFTLIIIFFSSRGTSRVISRISQSIQEISEGNFDTRLNDLPNDEIGDIGKSVNAMMRPLSTAILLEQQEGDTGSASSLINFSNTMLGCIGMIISGFRFFGDIRTLAAILIVFTAAGVVIFAVLMRSDIEIKHLK